MSTRWNDATWGASYNAAQSALDQYVREMRARRICGRCHTCGALLDYGMSCEACELWRMYASHGFTGDGADPSPCPDWSAVGAQPGEARP